MNVITMLVCQTTGIDTTVLVGCVNNSGTDLGLT